MVTIKQVAEKAGLSVSTVSRYLNNHPYISEDKRERIESAMKELNYTPSLIATQLRSKKSTMIGILVSRITNPFFSYLIDALERYSKAYGYKVLIVQTYDDAKAELNLLELLRQKVLSGIVMCSIEGNIKLIESYQNYGPIVLCNERAVNSTLLQVYTDQGKATFEGTKFLINQGYKRIAYCTGGDLASHGHGWERSKGFEKAIDENNLLVKREWIFTHVHTIEDGCNVAKKILQLPKENRPDAIFTNSDEVSAGIMKEYFRQGKKIPIDLAILGFDNQPYTELLKVPLTTIQQPIDSLGKETIRLLIGEIEGKPYMIDKTKLTLSLIKRKSV